MFIMYPHTSFKLCYIYSYNRTTVFTSLESHVKYVKEI